MPAAVPVPPCKLPVDPGWGAWLFGQLVIFYSVRRRLKSTWKLFKWYSCLSGWHSSWSFEAKASFGGGEKNQKVTIKRSVTLQGTELFGMPAARDGELPATASCTLCRPCPGPGWTLKSCLRKVWEFQLFGVSFWNCSPKVQAVWKIVLQTAPLQPFLPREKIKLFSSV